MLRERDAPELRRDVPDDFGSGQDEHVYGGIISAVVLPGVPFAGAFFGGMTTDCDDNKEPHLTGVVIHNLLASDNACALPCKHHENRSENVTQVSIFT